MRIEVHLGRGMMRSQLLTQIQMWVLLVLVAAVEVVVVVEAADAPIAKHDCNDTCGGVSIPFPIGMGVGCFLDEWFQIEGKPYPLPNGSFSTKPFLSKFSNIEVMELNAEAAYDLVYKMTVGIPTLNVCCRNTSTEESQYQLDGKPLRLLRR